MNKILVIVKKQDGGFSGNEYLINEYIAMKRSQGYVVELIGDLTGVLKSLLEEEELWGIEISSAQAEVMFGLDRYELVIYIPEGACSLKDMLVYDPQKLDKNMIFYNIGNMSIVRSLKAEDKTDESADPSRSGSDDTQRREEGSVDPEEISGAELASSTGAETAPEGSMSEDMGSTVEEIAGSVDPKERISSAELGEASEGTNREEGFEGTLFCDEEGPGDAPIHSEGCEEPSVDGSSGDAPDGDAAGSSEDSEPLQDERSSDASDTADLSEDEMSCQDPDLYDYMSEISSDKVILLSEGGIPLSDGSLQKEHPESSSEGVFSSDHSKMEGAEQRPTEEFVAKRPSVIRRLWLLCPWIIMGLMSILNYEKIAWLPFIIAVVGLFGSLISKRSGAYSKTPEWLCIFLALIALIVNIVHPAWMKAIGLPISMMAIVLFITAGFVVWDH